jgi:hypothetical protein
MSRRRKYEFLDGHTTSKGPERNRSGRGKLANLQTRGRRSYRDKLSRVYQDGGGLNIFFYWTVDRNKYQLKLSIIRSVGPACRKCPQDSIKAQIRNSMTRIQCKVVRGISPVSSLVKSYSMCLASAFRIHRNGVISLQRFIYP